MKIILFLISLIMLVAMTACRASTPASSPEKGTPVSMTLTSPAFTEGGDIPGMYSFSNCGGQNLSPALNWGEPPAGTKSFAIIMDDPDAKSATFVHWVIYNIPATSRGLPQAVPATSSLPDGSVQGSNSINTIGYVGPCPPSGLHHYSFRLYAMDVAQLDPSFASQDQRNADLGAHVLAKAQLIGTFTKK